MRPMPEDLRVADVQWGHRGKAVWDEWQAPGGHALLSDFLKMGSINQDLE